MAWAGLEVTGFTVGLAIFDLDNTLLGGDSDHAWGQFLVDIGVVDADSYQRANDAFYEQYQQGGLDIYQYLAFALEPLTQHSKTQLDAWHEQFMRDYVAPMRLAKADELLEKHRSQGDFLLIITATNRFVTGPIAAALGVDDLLASDPELVNGSYTGQVSGIPCFAAGKVTKLEQWLQANPFDLLDSYFYSDSHNDLPLLEMVANPIAVDPDEILEDHAKQRNWPIISLR